MAERLNRVAGGSTLRLTHYGRKSGQPFQVTIWFAVERDRVYIGTARTDRDWVRNVRKIPRVKLSIKGEIFDGDARFLIEQKEREHAQALIRRKYWLFFPVLLLAKLLVDTGFAKDRSGFFEVTFLAGSSVGPGCKGRGGVATLAASEFEPD